MKTTKTSEGWEIIPQTSDEEVRIKWLLESIQAHPGQQPCANPFNSGASTKRARYAMKLGAFDYVLNFQRIARKSQPMEVDN